MSSQIRANKRLIIAAIGISSAVLTGGVLGLIEASTGFALYSLIVWFIVPVGAFLAGLAAASGYYFAAKHFHQKPAGGIGLNMVLASIGAYLVVHYIPYYLLEVDGSRIKDAISFWSYLDFDIRHTSLSFNQGRTTSAELGSTFGYVYALIQLIGFAIGGLTVFSWLQNAPYCEKCEKYLDKTNAQERYTSEGETLVEQMTILATKLDERKYVDAVQYHSEQMGVPESAGHHLRTRITTHKCRSCGVNHLEFEASRLGSFC